MCCSPPLLFILIEQAWNTTKTLPKVRGDDPHEPPRTGSHNKNLQFNFCTLYPCRYHSPRAMGSRISFQQLLPGIKNPSAWSTEVPHRESRLVQAWVRKYETFFWTEFCHSLGLRRFCSSSVTATTGQTHERFLFSLDLSSESSPTSAASPWSSSILAVSWSDDGKQHKNTTKQPQKWTPKPEKRTTITLCFGTLEITSETFINVVKPN